MSGFKSFDFQNKNKNIDELLSELESLKTNNPNTFINYESFIITKEVYTSNNIEGNSLTLQETKLIIEDEITDGFKVKEVFEAYNLNKAIKKFIKLDKVELDTLLKIHGIITNNVLADEECASLRKANIYITSSSHIPCAWTEVADKINFSLNKFNESNKTIIDILKLKYEICFIHPFTDGNGRTSRMIMNALLNNYGYLKIIINPKDRGTYYNVLEQCNAEIGCESFIRFGVLKLLYIYKCGYID